MKFYPAEEHYALGFFVMDGNETVAEVKAGILAERERKNPYRRNNNEFYEVKTKVSGRFRRTKAKPPKPGDGTVKHLDTIAKAVALCEKHGAEFWALGVNSGFVWGVKDGRYVEVWGSGISEYKGRQ